MTTTTAPISYKFADVDGVRVFYREAGEPANPTLLLLHGFPSSSHQFRQLIPLLSAHFHIIAPDLPGFGFTEVPAEREYVVHLRRTGRDAGPFRRDRSD